MKHYKFYNPRLTALFIVSAFVFLVIAPPNPLLYKLCFKKAGNIAAAAGAPLITVSSPADGQAFKSTPVSITGSTEPSVSVNVYIDNSLAGSTTSDPGGMWSFTANSLAEGTHAVYATAADSTGNVGTSNTVTFEVDTVPPLITIIKPLDGSYVNLPVIEGRTEPGLAVTVYVYGKQATVTADLFGFWSYLDGTIPEGKHNVDAAAVDKAGNVGTTPINTFTLDMTRPVISADLFPADEMAQVPPDVTTKVYVYEQSPLDPANLAAAISLTEGGLDVGGTVYSAVYQDVYGKQYYEIAFKPAMLLKPSAKYTVSVNPLLADAAGNPVYPRTWTFTTITNQTAQNPHGNYTSNVNTCANCHKPHRADDLKLADPDEYQFQQIDPYCNACHDGTAAPIPDKWTAPNNHNFPMSLPGTVGPSACAGCHNPHLTLTPDNPAMLKDYYYYDHQDPTNPYLPDSSEEQLCETCHYAAIKNDIRVTYVRYQYKKRNTTTGLPDDYSLCLRCHNGRKVVDIASYYNGPSRHSLKAVDGSPLNGHIPCADCHNTHGSQNLKLLKGNLGHNKTQTFQPAGKVWDAATERLFCTGCHNNSTELYGMTANFNSGTPGHEAASTEFCNKCHGGSPVAAAHGPR